MSDTNDDVVLEPDDESGEATTAEQKLKVLRDKLKVAQTEAADNLAGWQRAKADYVNLQKRMRESGEALATAGVSALAADICAVIDSLEAAHDTVILGQLEGILGKHGITRIRATVGDTFDPNVHEPVQTLATDNKKEDNTIARVLQSGFMFGATTLRPARVVVYHTN